MSLDSCDVLNVQIWPGRRSINNLAVDIQDFFKVSHSEWDAPYSTGSLIVTDFKETALDTGATVHNNR